MSVEKQVKYWVGRVTSDRYWHQALDNHIWLTQQRYQIQTNSAVTNLLKCVLEVKVGDVILLTYSDGIYAYGNVVKCPFESGQVSNLKEVIKEKEHDFTNGIVKFDDNEVFYEDLRDGCECWGQRIMVDQWHFYLEPTRVSTEDLKKNITSGVSSMSLIGVTEKFAKDKIKELKEQYKMKYENIINLSKLLTFNYNLILTGAPGTGKTYLAKQIAQQMIFGEIKEKMTDEEQKQFDEQCDFVQFHPSYDFTDFVEGLRPMQDETGNVGFERKDGVFKAFCKKAVSLQKNDTIDNFNETWDKLVATLNENNYIDVPFLSNKSKSFRVELNEYGTGLANRTYPNDTYEQGGWISGQSKFFSKDQLYNIYRGLSGVPSGGHDNYRRAIVEEMKKSLGLKPYKEGNSVEKSDKKFVFIIDEINRGEISKIFGELFFSIDPGYRGEMGRVQTQYQNIVEDGDVFKKGFYVPENVYIIGTMNDIDRSVESMDFAFRRRFAFKEITAEKSQAMLDSEDAWGKDENGNSRKPDQAVIDTIKNKMDAINKVIFDDKKKVGIEGLSSAYHIGASYFLKLANYRNDDGSYDYDQLWENHLEGLLREYMRGMQDVEDKINTLKEAYKKPKATNTDDSGENQ